MRTNSKFYDAHTKIEKVLKHIKSQIYHFFIAKNI